MNIETQKCLISDIKCFPTYSQKFEQFEQNNSEVDFINNPEAFEFLKLEIYTRKQDNEYQNTKVTSKVF
jgi:hypothetical protein